MIKEVEFPSEGAMLRGLLFLPESQTRKLPLVIMAHGFSATVTMVADKYAEAFSRAGLAVLLYDHRNFGQSEGEPRQEINVWVQARGYRDAINFVITLPEVDHARIVLWGDSLSGAEVVMVGAIDARVKAVIAQIPAYGDVLPPEDPDGALFSAIQETFLHSDLDKLAEKITGPMPVVSFDQAGTPSALLPLTAFRWFIEYGGRYDTKWKNSVTIAIKDTSVRFNAALCAPHLKAPLLMVMSDNDEMEGANSDISRKVFDMVPQPKELVEIDGGHFGLLYYPSSLFDQASRAQTEFLKKWL